MKVKILCVGKIKEKYFTDAIDEYIKRLGRFCKTEIVEVAECTAYKTDNHTDKKQSYNDWLYYRLFFHRVFLLLFQFY